MKNIPLILQIFIMCLWLFVIPAVSGGCFRSIPLKSPGNGHLFERWLFRWVSGQVLLWACFQLICVPCVLFETDFQYVIYGFGTAAAVSVLAGIFSILRSGEKAELAVNRDKSKGRDKMFYVLWGCFGALLLLQLVQAVRLSYADGDDAYYVAVSTITENANIMYRKLPYTGGTTGVDIRHGLAPFPVWIAFLSHVSGIPAVSAAHVALPLMLIPMSYALFYLLGRRLFAGREKFLPVFLIFTELLILFGDYSYYTVENFMLARSRQGKTALGSIVLPMLLLLLLMFLERISERKKSGAAYWVLLGCTTTAGCLCSTLGAFLICLFLAAAGLCTAAAYHRWKVLVPLALSCVPCVCFAILYLLY